MGKHNEMKKKLCGFLSCAQKSCTTIEKELSSIVETLKEFAQCFWVSESMCALIIIVQLTNNCFCDAASRALAHILGKVWSQFLVQKGARMWLQMLQVMSSWTRQILIFNTCCLEQCPQLNVTKQCQNSMNNKVNLFILKQHNAVDSQMLLCGHCLLMN